VLVKSKEAPRSQMEVTAYKIKANLPTQDTTPLQLVELLPNPRDVRGPTPTYMVDNSPYLPIDTPLTN